MAMDRRSCFAIVCCIGLPLSCTSSAPSNGQRYVVETGVGDPCIMEVEFSGKSGPSLGNLAIDVGSPQCLTRICLNHYFKGRVTCPYGNGGAVGQTGRCLQAKDSAGVKITGLFTLDGTWPGGSLCCPRPNDVDATPLASGVDAQCGGRPAKEAVYCSCRCDVPDDPEIDRTKIVLCICPADFACVKLCDATHGNCASLPKGKWGSYCLKGGPLGSTFDSTTTDSTCGPLLTPPA